MKVLALMVFLISGCASLETDDDVKMTELQRAIKSKERGDVFYLSLIHISEPTRPY